MKKLYLFIFITFIINSSAQELNFEKLELKGLPSSEVHQVLQDKDGFIWIATDAGVCRYNGNTLKIFTVKDGLLENAVLKMKIDSKNRIWFSTSSNLFFYYEKGRFTKIAANAELKKIITSPICEFVFGENDTLVVPGINGKFEYIKIPPQNNYREIIFVKPISKSKDTDFCLLEIPTIPKQLISFLVYRSIRYIQVDSIINLHLLDSIYRLNIRGIIDFSRSTTSQGQIREKDKTIYLPYRNWLMIFKDYQKELQYNFPSEIYRVYFDADGDLWVGTRGNGVYFFKNGDLRASPLHSLPGLSVTSILLDREGSVFVSTEEKGVFQCMNKYVNTITERGTDIKINRNKLTATFASRKKLTASGTDSFQIENTAVSALKNSVLNTVSSVNQYTYYGVNQLLLCSFKNQPPKKIIEAKIKREPGASSIIELENDTILSVTGSTLVKILGSNVISNHKPSFVIRFATRLPDKRILVTARSDRGVFEFKNGDDLPFLDQIKELKTRVNWVTTDSSGNYWFATNEKGLYCYDTQQQLHTFNDNNGLISNKVNSILVTPENVIWCSTYAGLSKLSVSKNFQKIQIENFDKNHGIVDLEIGKIAGSITRYGVPVNLLSSFLKAIK